MFETHQKPIVRSLFYLLVLALQPQVSMAVDNLRVGAAKFDITPQSLIKVNPNDFGDFAGVHDPLFARVLVIDNGRRQVAMVALDLNQTGSTVALRERIQRELDIAADHVMVSITHNHSAPMIGKPSPGGSAKSGGTEVDAYTSYVNEKIIAALRQAKSALQPARMGVATGHADVNINRDFYTPGGYQYGHNLAGPSDKTVWVIKFETTAGVPIAVLFNYGVHPVVTRREKLVSGDLPGAAERYVEQQFGDKLVALWTMGPAGDQDPKVYDLAPGGSASAAKDARPGGFDVMNAQGFLVGAEVVRVANQIKPTTGSVKLAATERVLTCPFKEGARELQYFQTGGIKPEQLQGVPIRLGLLLIDQVALTAVSGEVLTKVYWHIKQSSPLANTILVSMANDSSGYMVDDAAYDTPTNEVKSTPVARGCAETGIVNGLTEMIQSAIAAGP
jgi:hypothetical protein